MSNSAGFAKRGGSQSAAVRKQKIQNILNNSEIVAPLQPPPHEPLNKSSVNDRLPSNYIVEYPTFLKSHPDQQTRRANDQHVEKTLNQALDRYENQLLAKEQIRKGEADDFKSQLEHNARYFAEMERRKMQHRLENRLVLEKQIREERKKKELLKNESKAPHRTNFGPEETEEIQVSLM